MLQKKEVAPSSWFQAERQASDKKGIGLYNRTLDTEMQYTAIPRLAKGLFSNAIYIGLLMLAMLVHVFLAIIGYSNTTLQLWNLVYLVIIVIWIRALRRKPDPAIKQMEIVRDAVGAREPSKNEQQRISEVFAEMASRGASSLRVHTNWWMIDSPMLQAFTVGEDLFITRGAIKSHHLEPILAHEIGHLNNRDGAMILSLRKFVDPHLQERITTQKTLSRPHAKQTAKNVFGAVKEIDEHITGLVWAAAFGGIGVIKTAKEWAAYFKERDYFADLYVLKLGYRDELLAYFDDIEDQQQSSPFNVDWDAPVELRRDRILDEAGF